MDVKCIDSHFTANAALYNGDCMDVLESIPDGSIGYSIFSPPFSDLYCYSSSERDMGNCRSHQEFMELFGMLSGSLFRVIASGRLVSIHCMDIPSMKERDGVIGLKDFSGEIIRAMTSAGFVYHSRVTIWKDPLVEATRTKALGLMMKQVIKDSSMCRVGLPDYVLTFRNPGENAFPIENPTGIVGYAGSNPPSGDGISLMHNKWRAYASPVWMDIRQTRNLQYRVARDPNDEKHICPLQLDVIERCLALWSNPGDAVLTPFLGVGSEAYVAVQMRRKAIGIELKPSYFRQAVKNVQQAEETPLGDGEQDMFEGVEMGDME